MGIKKLSYNWRESLDDADTSFELIRIFHLFGENSELFECKF